MQAAPAHLTQETAEFYRAAMAEERGSLTGAGLAGIDDYREPWELDAAPETR